MLSTNMSFAPGQTQTLTLTTSSQSLTVNASSSLVRLLMVGGSTGGIAFVRVGTGAQTATTADYPMLAGAEVYLMKGVGANTVAVIANTAGGSGTLYVTTGH